MTLKLERIRRRPDIPVHGSMSWHSVPENVYVLHGLPPIGKIYAETVAVPRYHKNMPQYLIGQGTQLITRQAAANLLRQFREDVQNA